jgi:hypothetical protein
VVSLDISVLTTETRSSMFLTNLSSQLTIVKPLFLICYFDDCALAGLVASWIKVLCSSLMGRLVYVCGNCYIVIVVFSNKAIN